MKSEDKRSIRNRPLRRIRVLFVVMFIALAANILYFVFFQSDSLVINEYNPRLEAIEASVIRGDILDRDGQVLAMSQLTDEGQVRVYPYANLFAHTIGYVGVGKTGLESYGNLSLIQSKNTFKDMLKEIVSLSPREGNALVTTLDLDLQQLASDLLGDKKGAVVAIEPTTGEILAMVSKPDFDPNVITDVYTALMADDENAPLLNRGTQGLYPPGSTFKTITTVAYLELFSPSDFFNYCEGEAFVGQKVIHCYNNTAHGRLSLDEAFAQSCNTSYGKIAEDLDGARLREISEQFLFNQALELEIPSETSQFTLDGDSTPNEMVETAIGQGKTLITPLNNALIACAVANGGSVYKPHLIKEVVSAAGETVSKTEPEILADIMSSSMAETLADYMLLTSTDGTAKSLNTDQYSVASKTGSAENPGGAAHAWYIGYAPVDYPEIAIAVVVENAGSSTLNAVPIADGIYQSYFGVVD